MLKNITFAVLCVLIIAGVTYGSGAIGITPGTGPGSTQSASTGKFDVLDAGTGMVAGQCELGADLVFQTQSGTGIHGFRTGENCTVFGPATGGNQWFFCGKPNVSLEISNNTSVYTSWRLADGFLVPTSGVDSPVGKFTTVDAGQLNVEFNTNLSRGGGRSTYAGREIAATASNDGGTPQVYLEYGRTTLSGGTKAVTFKNAFSVAPQCFCQDGTALAACDITGTTTSGTTINGTTTDIVSFFCIGDR